MAERYPLLPGEGVVCRGPDGILLTSDGHIGRFHKHEYEGISRIFRMIHVKDLTSITCIPRSKLQSLTLFLLIISTILTSIVFFLEPFSYGIDIFLYGFDINTCTELENSTWSCEQQANSWFYDSYWWYPCVIAVSLYFVSLTSPFNFRTKLRLEYNEGIIDIVDEFSSYFAALFWFSLFFNLLASPTPSNGISDGLDVLLFVGGLVFLLGTYHAAKRQLIPIDEGLNAPDKSDISKIKNSDVFTFHQELQRVFDLPSVEGDKQQLVSVGDLLHEELAEIKDRLDTQESTLMQIVPLYPDIFEVPSHYLGTVTIRISTETLLKHRLSLILPKASKKYKSLRNYTDELRKHDDGLDSDTLGSIETIISLGNQATHGRGSSKEDYISALQKFVEVVEWHIATPVVS